MMGRTRSLAPLLAVAIVVLSGVAGREARAGSAALTYPRDCATLQLCIDHVAAGGVVQIARDTLIAEDVSIRKRVTVRSASGHHGTIRSVSIGSATKRLDVHLLGLTVTRGIGIDFGAGASGHQVELRGLHVQNPDGTAVDVSTDVPATVDITSSVLEPLGEGSADALYLGARNPTGVVRFSVVGNRLIGHAATTENGIELDMGAAGHVVADILNNVIWDFGSCDCGGPAGILVDANEGITTADVNIVGNTIDTAVAEALEVRNDLLDGGSLSLDVFNNILSHASAAIELEESVAGTLTYRAGTNDSFANSGPDDLAGKDPGTGHLSADPLFVNPGAGDFRLQAGSPVLDAGVVCSPGGVANLDAARHGRVVGASLDLGALERGGVAPTGRLFKGTAGHDHFVGTPGADILCGYGGPDTLDGRKGRDHLGGGPGPDLLIGGAGPDRVLGGGSADTLCLRDGTQGNDAGDGGAGDDRFKADSGDVVVDAAPGATCAAP